MPAVLPSPVKPGTPPEYPPTNKSAAAAAPLPDVYVEGGKAPVVLPTADIDECRRVSAMMVLTTPEPCGVRPEGVGCTGTGTGMSPEGEME